MPMLKLSDRKPTRIAVMVDPIIARAFKKQCRLRGPTQTDVIGRLMFAFATASDRVQMDLITGTYRAVEQRKRRDRRSANPMKSRGL